jgi:hypothetical protein
MNFKPSARSGNGIAIVAFFSGGTERMSESTLPVKATNIAKPMPESQAKYLCQDWNLGGFPRF